MNILNRLKSNTGATAIEYSLMSALVATAITGAVATTGVNVKAPICAVANGISSGSCSGASGSGSSSSASSSGTSGTGSSTDSADSGTSSGSASTDSGEATDAYSADTDNTATASEDYASQFDPYDGNALSSGSIIDLGGTTALDVESLLSQLNDADAITGVHGLYYSGNNTSEAGTAITSLSELDSVLSDRSGINTIDNAELETGYNPSVGAPGSYAERSLSISGMKYPLFQVKTTSGSVYTVGVSTSQSSVIAVDTTTGNTYSQAITNASYSNHIAPHYD